MCDHNIHSHLWTLEPKQFSLTLYDLGSNPTMALQYACRTHSFRSTIDLDGRSCVWQAHKVTLGCFMGIQRSCEMLSRTRALWNELSFVTLSDISITGKRAGYKWHIILHSPQSYAMMTMDNLRNNYNQSQACLSFIDVPFWISVHLCSFFFLPTNCIKRAREKSTIREINRAWPYWTNSKYTLSKKLPDILDCHVGP